MIARFQALLPYELHVPRDSAFAAWEVEVDGYEARVLPLQTAIVDPRDLQGTSPAPIVESMEGVRLNADRVANPLVKIDGQPAFECNLLVIDFVRDDFDRSPNGEDPPYQLAFRLANDVLQRIRFVLRAPDIKPLAPDRTPWRIEYLNDDGSELERDPSRIRSSVGAVTTWNIAALTPHSWDAAIALPEVAPPIWDSLLLDAFSFLPSVEAAVVLAFASLEAFIDWCLDEFVADGAIDPNLYKWIAERDDFAKRPSATEQFDVLLKAAAGHSLKEKPAMWERFMSLKKARDTIVHTGMPVLRGVEIDLVKAGELVVTAQEIINEIESWMPEEKRRRLFRGGSRMEMLKPITAPPSGESIAPTEATSEELRPED